MSPPDSQAAVADPRPVAASSPLAALRHSTYRTMWIAQMFSNFGSLVQAVGAAWLMTELVHTPDWVAAVQAATSLPLVLFSALGGAVADLWERRIAMMAAQCWMLVSATVLAAMTAMGEATPILLLVMTFALSTGQAFSGPAWQASVSQLVPRIDLPAAIALGSMGFNLARSLGPALGGLIVVVAGAEGAFLFNACSFIGVLIGLVMWPKAVDKRSLPREHLFYAVVTGVRYVSAAPGIRAVMVRSFAFNLHSSAILALLPLIAKDSLNGGPFMFGILLGAFGAGAVIGGIFSVRLRTTAGTERLLQVSAIAYGIGTAVVGSVPWIWLDVVMLMAAGAAWLMNNSSLNFTVQMLAPNWVKGRSLSIYQTAMFGGTALGSWVWGHVATAYGLPTTLVAAGIVGVGTAVLALWFRAPLVDNIDLTPVDPVPIPDLAIALNPDSGPILVTVEYEVPPEKAAAFVTAMREIRRIRRRDGATGWTLYQDVSQPRRWLESYMLPTWTDLLRLRERRTFADNAAFARARAFHVGTAAPAVTRLLMQAPAHRISRSVSVH
jgi:MFS family permease